VPLSTSASRAARRASLSSAAGRRARWGERPERWVRSRSDDGSDRPAVASHATKFDVVCEHERNVQDVFIGLF